MKITYAARHGPHGNQDEDSITHALRELGHEVACFQQDDWKRAKREPADLVLIHKLFHKGFLSSMAGTPRVSWQFDLLSGGDADLERRFRSILPVTDFNFLTDGDFVANNAATHPRLHWLSQGADGRIAGMGRLGASGPKILFCGGRSLGHGRSRWIREMENRWGGDFMRVDGIHREALRDLVASAQIVVAPDAPGSDRYCSNRLFLMQGFGAFLIHPAWACAAACYREDEEIVLYRNWAELHEKISYWLERPQRRVEIAAAGLARTLKEHLYRHRVETLLQTVQAHGNR